MICYIIRHGKDDETIRGGWSQHPLTEEGVQQIMALAEKLVDNMDVKRIYTSDLCRTMQTAQILGTWLKRLVIPLSRFREVNNGDLAGMKNTIALERYPGLFWNQLDWEQSYPDGESPKAFYERICTAWEAFSQEIVAKNENVMLVTHGGVIQVILSLVEGRTYSNKEKQRNIPHASVIALSYENGAWKEIM